MPTLEEQHFQAAKGGRGPKACSEPRAEARAGLKRINVALFSGELKNAILALFNGGRGSRASGQFRHLLGTASRDAARNRVLILGLCQPNAPKTRPKNRVS